MELAIKQENSINIITITGTLDAANAKKLTVATLTETVKQQNTVIDMSGIDFIDSSGLGALVMLLKKATEEDKDVKLANLQAKPKILFEITRAYKIFDIFDSLEEAIASFSN